METRKLLSGSRSARTNIALVILVTLMFAFMFIAVLPAISGPNHQSFAVGPQISTYQRSSGFGAGWGSGTSPTVAFAGLSPGTLAIATWDGYCTNGGITGLTISDSQVNTWSGLGSASGVYNLNSNISGNVGAFSATIGSSASDTITLSSTNPGCAGGLIVYLISGNAGYTIATGFASSGVTGVSSVTAAGSAGSIAAIFSDESNQSSNTCTPEAGFTSNGACTSFFLSVSEFNNAGGLNTATFALGSPSMFVFAGAAMAISFVLPPCTTGICQHTYNATDSVQRSSLTIKTNTTATAGNLIIIGIEQQYSSNQVTVKDNMSNVYTFRGSTPGDGNFRGSIQFFTAVAASTGRLYINASYSTKTFNAVVFFELGASSFIFNPAPLVRIGNDATVGLGSCAQLTGNFQTQGTPFILGLSQNEILNSYSNLIAGWTTVNGVKPGSASNVFGFLWQSSATIGTTKVAVTCNSPTQLTYWSEGALMVLQLPGSAATTTWTTSGTETVPSVATSTITTITATNNIFTKFNTTRTTTSFFRLQTTEGYSTYGTTTAVFGAATITTHTCVYGLFGQTIGYIAGLCNVATTVTFAGTTAISISQQLYTAGTLVMTYQPTTPAVNNALGEPTDLNISQACVNMGVNPNPTNTTVYLGIYELSNNGTTIGHNATLLAQSAFTYGANQFIQTLCFNPPPSTTVHHGHNIGLAVTSQNDFSIMQTQSGTQGICNIFVLKTSGSLPTNLGPALDLIPLLSPCNTYPLDMWSIKYGQSTYYQTVVNIIIVDITSSNSIINNFFTTQFIMVGLFLILLPGAIVSIFRSGLGIFIGLVVGGCAAAALSVITVFPLVILILTAIVILVRGNE